MFNNGGKRKKTVHGDHKSNTSKTIKKEETPLEAEMAGTAMKVSSYQPGTHSNLDSRLEDFTSYFVEEFDSKMQYFLKVLQGDEYIKKSVSSYLKDTEASLKGLGIAFVDTAMKKFNEYEDKKEATQFKIIAYRYRGGVDPNIRTSVVKAAVEIFISYEMQIMHFDCQTGGVTKAMQKLAKAAVGNIIAYLSANPEVMDNWQEHLVEGVTYYANNGLIKAFSMLSLSTGGTVQDDNENINTTKVFTKSGIVHEKRFYKNSTSNTEKYGYRRLFNKEKIDEKTNNGYQAENNKYIKDYSYILSSQNIKEKALELLEKVNNCDPELMEQRIKDHVNNAMKQFKREVEVVIFRAIDERLNKKENAGERQATPGHSSAVTNTKTVHGNDHSVNKQIHGDDKSTNVVGSNVKTINIS